MMTPVDKNVLGHLKLVFPQLSDATIETSVLHPSNRHLPCGEEILLNRCIDDLLELRTHKATTHSLENNDSIYVDSDDDVEVLRDASRSRTLIPTDPENPVLIDSQENEDLDWGDDFTYDDNEALNALSEQAAREEVAQLGKTAEFEYLESRFATASVHNKNCSINVDEADFAPACIDASTPEKSQDFIANTNGFVVPSILVNANVHVGTSGLQNSTVPSASVVPKIVYAPTVLGAENTTKSLLSKSTDKQMQPTMNRTHLIAHSPSAQARKVQLERISSISTATKQQLPVHNSTQSRSISPKSTATIPQFPVQSDTQNGNVSPKSTYTKDQLSIQSNIQDTGQVHMRKNLPKPAGTNQQIPAQYRSQNKTHFPAAETFQDSLRTISTQIPDVKQSLQSISDRVHTLNSPTLNSGLGIQQKSEPFPLYSGMTQSDSSNPMSLSHPAPSDRIPSPKSPEDVLMANVTEVLTLIPDVDPNHVKALLQSQYIGPTAVNDVVLNLLESGSYPKVNKSSTTTRELPPEEDECDLDFYKCFGNSTDDTFSWQSCVVLQNEFRRLSVRDIRCVAAKYRHHYAPTRKCIYDSIVNFLTTSNGGKQPDKVDVTLANIEVSKVLTIPIKISSPDGGEKIVHAKLLKNIRSVQKFPSQLHKDLKKEIEFVINKSKKEKEAQDHLLAMNLNEHEYETTGQLIECGCCYGEFPFDSMVQCYEGHLFCKECLQRYAQEAVYGSGKAELKCMTSGCDASYPISQLQRSLTSKIFAKYEDRVKEETINLADLEDLVRCPHCDFAALLDPGDKVFKCQNPKCCKETCRYCKEDWSDHFGIPCSELEKKDETKLRLSFEEKMTEAKIRKCHRCKTSFTKSDGCNKMTCRCGAKMCYICRKPDIDYNHFCRHPRDPGKSCTHCSDCSLWTNPEEDDERAVQEIQKLAQEERKKMGFEEERVIGVPSEPAAKRARIQ